jgi:hypothetical protein
MFGIQMRVIKSFSLTHRYDPHPRVLVSSRYQDFLRIIFATNEKSGRFAHLIFNKKRFVLSRANQLKTLAL